MYLYCLDCDVKGNNYVNKFEKKRRKKKTLTMVQQNNKLQSIY